MPISMLGGRRVILLTEGKAPPNFHTLFKVIDTKYSKSAVWRGAQKSNLWLSRGRACFYRLGHLAM